jgi:hypothetical protein
MPRRSELLHGHIDRSTNRRVSIMNSIKSRLGLGLAMALAVTAVSAGPLDPDCTAEKAAKSAAAKATVGVGGRCDPKEAMHDTAKDAVDIGDNDKKDKNDKDKDDKNDKNDKDKDKDKEKDSKNDK